MNAPVGGQDLATSYRHIHFHKNIEIIENTQLLSPRTSNSQCKQTHRTSSSVDLTPTTIELGRMTFEPQPHRDKDCHSKIVTGSEAPNVILTIRTIWEQHFEIARITDIFGYQRTCKTNSYRYLMNIHNWQPSHLSLKEMVVDIPITIMETCPISYSSWQFWLP